jgi:sugar/nucleoside kinase (ribokinase family)
MTTRVLGIGATLIDELYFTTTALVPHSSNPAHKTTHIGGVMHNIMYHLALLGAKPGLITAIAMMQKVKPSKLISIKFK